ncbi:bifunctional diguanylate cyclase/phosphodiesterase [Vibrio mangrovi]|uniref:EAL domain-containing protein n=1 Tax=Vibrio mangrovi TaxID=474394 RepID=A0A1Y6IY39_9VIBR|nr:EAL domain-containing protein [Vibrio mangrovi]MDW6004976.1 EAL domain-containing protein [Vibrio mangrovi]SMS01740.1 RNase E specificity factor CsrD [Vibrio mangrovi]
MTLYKQIVMGMIALFILLISSVFIIQFNTTRSNLEQQQSSEVSNTINTVGLALAPYLEDKDTIAAESVINALFDGSTYSLVKLTFFDERPAIVRTYPITPNGVPKWFTHLNLFKPISESRVVTSGWMQLAEVEITSHPGEAYRQLWNALIRLSIVFGCVFLVGLVAIALIIRHSLQPLHAIVIKMEQVARSQFGKPLPKPVTKDLVHVVDGINRMSSQVEKSFMAQAREAQQLRDRAYIDAVSKLGNRSYYMNQLESWLSEGGYGAVAMLQATFIEEIYDTQGYADGDAQVKALAEHLKLSIHAPGTNIARLSNSEFAFLFPHTEDDEIQSIAEDIMNCVSDMTPDPTGLVSPEAYLGLVLNKSKKTTTEILSLLDNALASAKADRAKPYCYISSEDNQIVMGKQQWKALVDEAMKNDAVNFRFQSACDKDGKELHKEVFSSIEKEGHRYSAIQYLFALEQLHVSHIFDQYVIQQMFDKLAQDEHGEDTLAINISASSISEPSFIRWVSQLLTQNPSVARRLHFEIPEACFIDIASYTALLCHGIREAGADFGVDHYGRHFQTLDYLNEFRPRYVKLDYLFTHNLKDEKQTYTLASISRAAHNLDIVTVASRIETQEQLDFLAEHFIDVFQGFIVDK